MLTVLLSAALMACPAEQLGIELPKGGIDTVSEEDIRRDLHMLDGQPDDRRERIQHRLEQMHTLPGFGSAYTRDSVVCGLIDGAEAAPTVVLALDEGHGAARSAAPVAAMISLAKSFDVPSKPDRSLLFCAAPSVEAYLAAPALPVEETHAMLSIGPLGGASLSSADHAEPLRRVHVQGTMPEEDDRMSLLDSRILVGHVRRLRQALDAL